MAVIHGPLLLSFLVIYIVAVCLILSLFLLGGTRLGGFGMALTFFYHHSIAGVVYLGLGNTFALPWR